MVIIIDFTSQNEHVIFSKDISTDIKNTSNLFTYFVQQLKQKYSNIRLQNNNTVSFDIKVQLKKILVMIQDSSEGNFLSIDFTSKKSRFKQFFNSLSKKHLFGVKLSSLAVLIVTLSSLSVLITLFWENSQALLIIGITSLVLAVLALICYYPLLKLYSSVQSNRYNIILEISNEIEKLISDYLNQKTPLKRCWSCFSEVSLKQDICEKCEKSSADKQ